MKQRKQEPMTEDRRTSIKMGSWMSLVAVVLVMTPSVYRLVNEQFHCPGQQRPPPAPSAVAPGKQVSITQAPSSSRP